MNKADIQKFRQLVYNVKGNMFDKDPDGKVGEPEMSKGEYIFDAGILFTVDKIVQKLDEWEMDLDE